MILSETYTLKDSLTIPKFGLGTWLIDDKDTAEAVRKAIGFGYRLIDTARHTATKEASAKASAPHPSRERHLRHQQDCR